MIAEIRSKNFRQPASAFKISQHWQGVANAALSKKIQNSCLVDVNHLIESFSRYSRRIKTNSPPAQASSSFPKAAPLP
jgi:hypothetical protein